MILFRYDFVLVLLNFQSYVFIFILIKALINNLIKEEYLFVWFFFGQTIFKPHNFFSILRTLYKDKDKKKNT